MGQFLLDGKNEQIMSKKYIFCRFTVSKWFDFLKFLNCSGEILSRTVWKYSRFGPSIFF